MKFIHLVLCFIILVTTEAYSQELIRGYTAGTIYGFPNYSSNDYLGITHGGNTYLANFQGSKSINVNAGFPFDYGYKQHRFEIVPGFNYEYASYIIADEVNLNISGINNYNYESIFYGLQVGLRYKYNFVVFNKHLAFGLGTDIRYNFINYATITSDNNDLQQEISFAFNYSNANHLRNHEDLNLCICPHISMDIYLTKWTIMTLYYTQTPIMNDYDLDFTQFNGAFGVKMSYYVSTRNKSKSDFLQIYKKQ